MKKTRIIFFGTPEFAVQCLDYLVQEKHDIVAVVTAPDRMAGRGKKIIASPLKKYSDAKGLKVLQPDNLKDLSFIATLTALKPDLHVVVAFRMLPKSVWSIPPLGTINLHASLLPDYRGAAPINWVLINNEKKTGVTTFIIDDKIDTGMLLLKEEIPIENNDDFGTLHDKLILIGAPLISKTIQGLSEGSLIPKPQEISGEEHKAPKLNTQNTAINWKEPLNTIVAKVKGLSPHPGAWTLIENNGQNVRMKIFKASALVQQHSFPENRIVVENKKLLIATKEGFLNCEIIQLPNKKRMESQALLNGFTFSKEAMVLQ